jgi:hypothetical protein
VKFWRVVPLDRSAEPDSPGGALWIPRYFQGAGRHDNPDLYGCLYVSEDPVSAIAEHLAPFRGTGRFLDSMLTKGGVPLALVEIDCSDRIELIDLDDPLVLKSNSLRPSLVATRIREKTQTQAATLFNGHPKAVGLRWWSTLEASWINLTVFDRALPELKAVGANVLDRDHPTVREAASSMGLGIAPAI